MSWRLKSSENQLFYQTACSGKHKGNIKASCPINITNGIHVGVQSRCKGLAMWQVYPCHVVSTAREDIEINNRRINVNGAYTMYRYTGIYNGINESIYFVQLQCNQSFIEKMINFLFLGIQLSHSLICFIKYLHVNTHGDTHLLYDTVNLPTFFSYGKTGRKLAVITPIWAQLCPVI